jgi:glycosyltransferase involved in cell wall biosynthesis
MHILIVALHRPIDPTGVCRHAANLARCLSDREEISQITIVIGEWQTQYFEALLGDNLAKVSLISVNIKNSATVRNLWFLFGLPKLAKHFQVDRIHLSFPLPFIRSYFPCSVITTIHDLYPYQFPENFGYQRARFNQIILRYCISQSDGFTCVSNTTLKTLHSYFPHIHKQKIPVAVTYNFVDFTQSEHLPIIDFQEKLQFPFILCVAQHRKNKNIELLIEAFYILISNNSIDPITRLVLVGSPGPETERLQTLIQNRELASSILMLSSINDLELCWLYKNCQLFVIPSSLEGFCIPIIEALSFSCKVVCSNIEIFQEIGSTDCTYFDLTGDAVRNLWQAIHNALVQPNFVGGGAYKRFSKSSVAEQYLDFHSKFS